MVSRHTITGLLFSLVAASLALLDPRETQSALADQEGAVPSQAVAALREGRFLRATQLLGDYLNVRPDTTPSAIIFAAEAAAGLADWDHVRALLEGRSWLDQVGSGYGWNLLGRSQVELGQFEAASASLERFLTMSDTGGSRAQAIALLRRGDALAEQKKYGDAIAAYDRAAKILPQIEDWIHVFAASAAATAGDTALVATRLAAVDATLALEWAWRTVVRAYRNADDLGTAQSVAERAAAGLTDALRVSAAWNSVGSIRDARGDRAGARAAYVRAIERAGSSSAAIEPAHALSELGELTPDDQLIVGRVYLRHGNLTRGVAGLRAFIDAGRGTDAQRDQLRYDIANAHFRFGEYRAAEKALLAVAGSASDRNVAADALYTAARAQYRDGRVETARATLNRIIRDYADQSAAVRASYLSGDLDHDQHLLDEATNYYRQAIRFAPSSSEAALARMRLGGIAFARQRYEDALREFEDYRNTHRAGALHQQATYWSAQALSRLGRRDEAQQRLADTRTSDPFSYYGGLAAAELGDDTWYHRLGQAPVETDHFTEQIERALARVDLLREIGWEEAATFEMDRVRRHFARVDGALYSLAEELNERGFTNAGINLGWEIFRREGAWNVRLMRIVYPFPFQNIVLAEARERRIDPFLAAALIRQESMFNARARSPAGALGLMQVMPQTGRTLARHLGVPRFKAEMLFQPELNIHFGMAYLADQLRAYNNRIDAVLAAYNAGPTRVERWQEFPEYSDQKLFAERIPFDETRDYVRIVQNNRRLYAVLYADIAEPSERP